MKTRFHRHLALIAIFASMPLISSLPANAQMYGLHAPMRPPAPVYLPNMPTHPMPFREVALMLHRFGFHDIARIEQRGETYRIAASDRAGLPVMIMIDAYDGDILDVRPIGAASRPSPSARSRPSAKIISVAPPNPTGSKPVAQKPPLRSDVVAVLPKATPAAVPTLKQMAAGRIYPPVVADVLRNMPAAPKR